MKQRLVGTIVLGCLAIIFIPILLDGEGVSAPVMTSNIQQPPPLPEVPDIEPERPEITADAIARDDTAATPRPGQTGNGTAEVPPAPEKPRLTTAGVPETWSVRLGSFAEMGNAEALVERLRNSGYKAYSRPLQTSRGALTGVYVGPVLTESEAGSLQQELSKAFELEGVVVQFSIDEPEE